jgi:AraC-like DNA-binding protein
MSQQHRDLVARAHLREPGDTSHVMFRYPASAALEPLVRHFWLPVWSVADPAGVTQQVLQYPICLIVVASDYARFYGPTSGLSRTNLVGDGWAAGVALQPAAGLVVGGRSVSEMADTFVDLATIDSFDPASVIANVTRSMERDPHDVDRHASVVATYEDALQPLLPVDGGGRLINNIVAFIEERTDVVRVSQVCEQFAVTERQLQRLCARRVGLGPKWIIQRRRLHEAAEALRAGSVNLAAIAADLGYADQAHFTRDFKSVTGRTPGEFAAVLGAN